MCKMTCSPSCPYFPNVDTNDWKYNEEGLKVRKKPKDYVCFYDGHVIKDWYSECPKTKDEQELKEADNNDD